jgi:hypothetical protein
MYQTLGYPLIALEQCSKSIELEKTEFPEKYMLLLGNLFQLFKFRKRKNRSTSFFIELG